jgi:hypothetical protein
VEGRRVPVRGAGAALAEFIVPRIRAKTMVVRGSQDQIATVERFFRELNPESQR